MKRKYGEGSDSSGPSLYSAPPLESTMLLDTGGIKTRDDCIGAISTIPVSASISSGTRLFQYNKFYWNNDLFTFNMNSCAVMLVLSWWNSAKQKTCTMFYGVFLPQTLLTTYQSLQNDVTFDPSKKKRMIDDLLYYLNGMWAQQSAGPPDYYSVPPDTGPIKYPPSFYTNRFKGFIPSAAESAEDFGFFTTSTPPLLWISVGSNQNIALIKNPDFWIVAGNIRTDYDCAFQLVNPYENWTLSPGNPNNDISWFDGSIVHVPAGGWMAPSYKNNNATNFKGWCGRGAFSIGFAQKDDETSFGNYTDIFGSLESPVLQDLWQNYTTFLGQESLISMDGFEWKTFVEDHYLTNYTVVAYFLPNFLPSRYVAIASSILAGDQKAITISNSPVLSQPNIIGVQFLTLDRQKTLQDTTLSGIYVSSRFFGNASSASDTPVLHMNPMYSILSVDIELFDEYETAIQNFRSAKNAFVVHFNPTYTTFLSGGLGTKDTGNFLLSYVMGENSFVLDNSGGFTANVTSFPIPAWLSSLNPLNAISIPPPSQQPLLAPFSTYNCSVFYMLFAAPTNNLLGGFQTVYPPDFSPSLPYSGNIIHFGRVLGY